MLFYLAMIDTEEDKRKFERIYLAYKQTMYYAANRILKNTHTSEDAVHQAFIRIINHLEKINENECHKTRAFLVVITEHIAIDIYRKQKKESTLSYDELEIYVADTHVESYEETDELTAVFEKLPVNYSTVLRLKFSQGYSDSVISEILNITEENVRKRISRAKKKLAQLLQKEGDTE
ncbi:MAG: sigma-70 family RNA polymerase sigma factor [Anaerovoracaceae bacterium]